jgi:hypothetical protein
MKKSLLLFVVLAISILCFPAFSQTDNQAKSDTALLGLPGDNLDLYAALNIFQKSKTIEDFEKTLNLKETGINNLDLNLNDTVDFIKVVTKQEGTNFTFILQVDVSKKEVQDVAVILVSKDKDGKVTMQIVGDKDLYGKDYVIEPKPAAPPVTANPGYTGANPVTTTTSTTVVVVESAPIVQYVYSPVYVPYYPPYYYHYYPPYYAAFTVMAVSVYHHNNYYHHGGYHGGGYGNTVVIHNTNNYNNYNNSRNSSNTVNNNNKNGNYNSNKATANQSKGSSSGAKPTTNQAKGSSASAKPTTSQSKGSSASSKPTTSQSKGSSSASKPTTSQSKGSSASRSSSGASRSMSGGGGGRRR